MLNGLFSAILFRCEDDVMADFNNLDELKALKARGVVSDTQYEQLKSQIAKRIIRGRREEAYAKSGIIYILLAFFLGTIGLHNLYAGYAKRGWTQAILTLVSPLFAFLPLLLTAAWAWVELFVVNKSANGVFFKGSKIVLWSLRILSIIVFVLVWQNAELVTES